MLLGCLLSRCQTTLHSLSELPLEAPLAQRQIPNRRIYCHCWSDAACPEFGRSARNSFLRTPKSRLVRYTVVSCSFMILQSYLRSEGLVMIEQVWIRDGFIVAFLQNMLQMWPTTTIFEIVIEFGSSSLLQWYSKMTTGENESSMQYWPYWPCIFQQPYCMRSIVNPWPQRTLDRIFQ